MAILTKAFSGFHDSSNLRKQASKHSKIMTHLLEKQSDLKKILFLEKTGNSCLGVIPKWQPYAYSLKNTLIKHRFRDSVHAGESL